MNNNAQIENASVALKVWTSPEISILASDETEGKLKDLLEPMLLS